MTHRATLLVVGVLALVSMGASYRTTNFVVEAPTPQIAQQIGQTAEHYRKEKAIQWLGYEMPPWPEPCPLHAKVTMSGAGGATSFAFDRGRVLGQQMNIEGSLDRLLSSVLPHEVTHTVFAFYFRCPVPRWADEGGSVLSEDDAERNRHDMLCRQILNTPGRAFPLRRLFALKDYPSDVMALYAQGFSVSSFLVANSSRQAFLNFVAHGMQQGWDSAVQAHYHYKSVEELEQAWLTHLRNTKKQPAQLASNTAPQAPTGEAPQTVVVRQTAPPAQPQLMSAPVYRGQAPDSEPRMPAATVGRPTHLPDPLPPNGAAPAPAAPSMPAPQAGWQPIPPPGSNPPPAVQLGQPQFGVR
ncbi:MAG: hypothetical protein K2R98_17035 [Gemmataceae bacterium]|nr:hypothetical protein [Gemmataceae bacterium]